jgi:peptidoglycan hydrolase-like protein with peptidoglycan-binding domain
MSMSRYRWLGLISLALVATTLGGYVLGRRIRSPADAAARTAPPAASLITVPAASRALTTEVILRGTVRFGNPHLLRVSPSERAHNSGVIVELAAVDTQLDEGSRAAVVAGRPVFVLRGEKPSYRDLEIGASGDDVRQLESALQRLGYEPGDVDGIFDIQTSAVLALWYADAGFSAALDEASRPFAPASEIVFLPETPVRVDAQLRSPGDPVEGPLLSLTDASIAIDVAVPIGRASLLAVGQQARIEEPDLGIALDGEVTELASAPGSHGLEPQQIYMQVRPKGMPSGLVGASVKVSIAIEATQGAVLAVPAAALSATASGETIVQVRRADGSLEDLPVTTGLAAQGYVEIKGGGLKVGDLVVIGLEAAQPALTPLP